MNHTKKIIAAGVFLALAFLSHSGHAFAKDTPELLTFDIHFAVLSSRPEVVESATLEQFKKEIEILNQYFVSQDGSLLARFRFHSATFYDELKDSPCEVVRLANTPVETGEWSHTSLPDCHDPRVFYPGAINFFVHDSYSEEKGWDDRTSRGSMHTGQPWVLLDWKHLNHSNGHGHVEEHEMGHAFGLADENTTGSSIMEIGTRTGGFRPDQEKIIAEWAPKILKNISGYDPENLIRNPGFEGSKSFWNFQPGAALTEKRVYTGSLSANLEPGSSISQKVYVFQSGEYNFSFVAHGDAEVVFFVNSIMYKSIKVKNKDYTKYSLSAIQLNKGVEVEVRVQAKEITRLDDFSLRRVDEPVVLKQPATISGVISLPPGHKAPASGMTIELSAIVSDYEYQCQHCFGGTFTIPENESSVPFSIEIKAKDAPRYRLRYFSRYAGYLRSGYYSRKGTIPFMAVTPEMWIDISKGNVSGIHLTITADASVSSYEDYQKQSEQELERIVKDLIKPYYTEFEKALVLHDYIVTHLDYYSDENARTHKLSSFQDIYYDYIPLLTGIGICGSYSNAFARMAKLAGLESKTTKARLEITDHAWNETKIYGKFYHIDTTYNDLMKPNEFWYRVFLLTDAQMEAARGNPNLWEHPGVNPDDEPFVYLDSMYPHKKELRAAAYRRIFGNVRLPEGDAAPSSGLWVKVAPHKMGYVRVFIPPGKNHAFFALQIPFDAKNKSVLLRFFYREDVAIEYFYALDGAPTHEKLATPIDISGDDVSIDIKIPKHHSVSNLPIPQETLRLINENKQVRIVSRLTGCSLYEENGEVFCAQKPGKNDVWIFEKVQEKKNFFFRIRNVQTGHALHIENLKNSIECTEFGKGWWSAQWALSGADSESIYFDNRWLPERIVAGEGNNVLHQSNEPPKIEQSQWIVEDAYDK